MSASEEKMLEFMLADGIPREAIEREFVFAAGKNWRSDFHIPSRKILVEVDGGIGFGKRSRHTEPAGFSNDAIKLSVASAMGYTIFRCTGARGHMRKIASILGRHWRGDPLDKEFVAGL